MGVSEPRYSAHHAYGVVQVQVQVDLQVGQRPAETFFQIRGEERMEKAPWRTRKKDEARSLARTGGTGTRGESEVPRANARRGGRRSRTHFANSLARCFSGLHFATSRVRRPLESRSADWKTTFSMLRAMNEEEQAGRNRPRPLFPPRNRSRDVFQKGHEERGGGEADYANAEFSMFDHRISLRNLIFHTYFPANANRTTPRCYLIFRVSSLK